MEVKIGVQFGTRELVVESNRSADEIEESIADAVLGNKLFSILDDEKGSRIVVPPDKLAYVEILQPEQRSVGFGRL